MFVNLKITSTYIILVYWFWKWFIVLTDLWAPERFGCARRALECSRATSGSPRHRATYALAASTSARSTGTWRGSSGGEGGAGTVPLPSGSSSRALRRHSELNSRLTMGMAYDWASQLYQHQTWLDNPLFWHTHWKLASIQNIENSFKICRTRAKLNNVEQKFVVFIRGGIQLQSTKGDLAVTPCFKVKRTLDH